MHPTIPPTISPTIPPTIPIGTSGACSHCSRQHRAGGKIAVVVRGRQPGLPMVDMCIAIRRGRHGTRWEVGQRPKLWLLSVLPRLTRRHHERNVRCATERTHVHVHVFGGGECVLWLGECWRGRPAPAFATFLGRQYRVRGTGRRRRARQCDSSNLLAAPAPFLWAAGNGRRLCCISMSALWANHP